ncbi:D-alanyl-D-alanine carboxypeptidase [Lachnospiraceae bacterium TWA4]|nr:D-alanyl-D-alanine carboxypeptidase [Lachnospiraceae bacterium TWA4]
MKKFFIFLLIFLIFPKTIYANESNSIKSNDLHAKSAVLMDGDTGRVLYGKDENLPLANASTTKILTCILTLEYGNLEDIVPVSSHAASMPDVQLNIRKGETYYLKDLLYSLMLESHNDSAVAIAEYMEDHLSISHFYDLMNAKAKKIGCKNSHFVTPNGLDSGDHHTTATDLALIMRYCLKFSPKSKEFIEITRTTSHSFTDCAKKRSFTVNNHNALLQMRAEAISGKTGFTNKAGYCYVGAVKKDKKFFIVALLASGWPPHKSYKWSDTTKLIDYGFKNYEFKQLTLPQAKLPLSLQVKPSSIYLLAKKDEDLNLSSTWTIFYPLKKDTKAVGWQRWYLNQTLLIEKPIELKNPINSEKSTKFDQ